MRGSARRLALSALLLLSGMPAQAECSKDLGGEVYCGAGLCARGHDGVIWCSRFDDGGAQISRRGKVLCGRGQCAKDFGGNLFCSAVTGGAVLKDSRGRVRCEGSCEQARASFCENTRAAIAD